MQKVPDEDINYFRRFFTYEHLPPILRNASEPFGKLAEDVMTNWPKNNETKQALRELLEAKDCAVRARSDMTGEKAFRSYAKGFEDGLRQGVELFRTVAKEYFKYGKPESGQESIQTKEKDQ